MMAECYALSMSLREVLPLRDLVECMSTWSGLGSSVTTNFKVLCWEDNEGAWTLANLDPGQHAPRSKFCDSKVHWFRSHLNPETNPRGLKFESSSSITLDLTSRDRYQLQLEISSEDPNVNVSLPIGRLARQVMSPK